MIPEQIQAAKNTAATKACETYVQTIKEILGETPIEIFDGTMHVRCTLIFEEDKKPVGLFMYWKFSSDPDFVKQVMHSQNDPIRVSHDSQAQKI